MVGLWSHLLRSPLGFTGFDNVDQPRSYTDELLNMLSISLKI